MRYLLVLLVALALASPDKAAPIFFDLELISGGTVVGTGSFSIEGDEFTGSGEETFYPADSTFQNPAVPKTLLSLDVTIDGQTFAIDDDIDFPNLPEVSFDDGTPDVFEYIGVNEASFSLVLFDGFDFRNSESVLLFSGSVAITRREVVAVAEPGALLLLGAGLLAMGAAVCRRRAAAA